MSDWPGNGLYTMNAQGHNTRRVVAFDNPESGGIAWAPDNRRIAYGTDVDGLFVLDRTTGRTRQISAEYDSYPSWSPDGRQIAFQHDSTGNGTYSIWIMSTDGTHRRQITHPPGVVHDLSIRDSQPAWSPDGQQIAFQRGYDTWVISLRTRHAHLVARFASAPTWSPSGHTILLSVFRGASSGLFLVSPKGGHLRKVISGQGWALAESSWTRAAR